MSLSPEQTTILKEQIKRIHAAVNDGTLDRETVADALDKLSALADAKSDSFSAFTGQPKAPEPPKPAVPEQPPIG